MSTSKDKADKASPARQRMPVKVEGELPEEASRQTEAGDRLAASIGGRGEQPPADEMAGAIQRMPDKDFHLQKVLDLDDCILELVGLPGQEPPEAQHALSETDLVLAFAYEVGKKGHEPARPTSPGGYRPGERYI